MGGTDRFSVHGESLENGRPAAPRGAVGLALGVGVGMSIRYDSWRPARLD